MAADNNTVRASKASRAGKSGEAGELSQPVRAKRAGAWGPVQANCNLTYLTLVGHLNKIWLVILQGTLAGHLKSVM